MRTYPSVPGRGHNSERARQKRLAYLKSQGYSLDAISEGTLSELHFQHKIEAAIGTVEIPVGLAGPLLLQDGEEWVYAPMATLEGALLASVNRGAKALSLSGGVAVEVHKQRMVRCPMAIFSGAGEAARFGPWADAQLDELRQKAEAQSNHARLLSVSTVVIERSVHLRFVYTTGDASGQNMTTTCTWHAMKWLMGEAAKAGFRIEQWVIEGNGSSDKKLSAYAQEFGRGIAVTARALLSNDVLDKVLRVRATALLDCMEYSKELARKDGMWGYNINAANAIAGVFAATGQDLGSLHESSGAFFDLEEAEGGVLASLYLPNLVAGTVGGGTMLPKQQAALALMGCDGAGQAHRFASLIAGFALGLELSTLSAIVGGQFAAVHERMGRNKPVNWLVKAELGTSFIRGHLAEEKAAQLESAKIAAIPLAGEGILSRLSARVNRKLTGLFPFRLDFVNGSNELALLKLKPTGREVLHGLRSMARAIEPQLADELERSGHLTEYHDCHLKEGAVYRALQGMLCPPCPLWLGGLEEEARELYSILIEWLPEGEMRLFNTEQEPWLWGADDIAAALDGIGRVHRFSRQQLMAGALLEVPHFAPWPAARLYAALAAVAAQESGHPFWEEAVEGGPAYWRSLEARRRQLATPKALVHNDFNPRNVALRADGRLCIYDWELAMWNIPQRDIVEWLSFILPVGFKPVEALQWLRHAHALEGEPVPWGSWLGDAAYAVREYLLTRVSFYLSGNVLADYPFAERVSANALRLFEVLDNVSKEAL